MYNCTLSPRNRKAKKPFNKNLKFLSTDLKNDTII